MPVTRYSTELRGRNLWITDADPNGPWVYHFDYARIEAELERLKEVVRAMHKADDDHGCGFYGYSDWNEHYAESRLLCGMGER